ncbi:hypothetical protein R6Q57_027489 [Mikania cordata]
MKKVMVAQKDQELLKNETIVSIPTQKYQLEVVQQLNVQQGEIRLRKRVNVKLIMNLQKNFVQ